MTNLLDEKINEIKAENFDEIVAIVRGGLSAAQYIAKQLQLPVGVYYPSNDTYSTPRIMLAKKKSSKILFVEDLVAQGRTYNELEEFMKGFPETKWEFLPVLVDEGYNVRKFKFQCLKTETWVVFPYEKMEKTEENDRSLFRFKTTQLEEEV